MSWAGLLPLVNVRWSLLYKIIRTRIPSNNHIHLCTFALFATLPASTNRGRQERYIPATANSRCFLLVVELGGHTLFFLARCFEFSEGGGGNGDGSAGGAWGLTTPKPHNPNVKPGGRAGVGEATTPIGYGAGKIVGGLVPSGVYFRGRPRFCLGGSELALMAGTCTTPLPAAGHDERGAE